MRKLTVVTIVVCLAGIAPAQSFECQAPGPFATSCCNDCEDVWSNNAGLGTGITGAPVCGMPAAGNQYARLTASGDYPGGFPLARPIPFTVSEIRVVVPDGAAGVFFQANWFNAEGGPSVANNDGLEISIIAPDGVTMLVPIAYVDTNTALAPGGCVDPLSGGFDVLTNGVDTVIQAFAPVPFGSYLSIVCFNGGDTLFPSSCVIDRIAWGDPTSPGFELGDITGPRVRDLTPLASFRIGVGMNVQLDAGLPFLEGWHCLICQIADFNSPPQFITPGVAGALFLRARTSFVLSEGLLTGGINPGRGPVVNLQLDDPALSGIGVVFQAYVITEQLTNQTWTSALMGWFR